MKSGKGFPHFDGLGCCAAIIAACSSWGAYHTGSFGTSCRHRRYGSPSCLECGACRAGADSCLIASAQEVLAEKCSEP